MTRAQERFDVIVIGAGPAGATSAYFLARAGLSTLLVDRARFPRDKPCGGGVTARAASLLPFSLEPVVDATVDEVEIGLAYGRRFVRASAEPLVLMTERARLDTYLVSQAVAQGADFRDAAPIEDVRLQDNGATVVTETWAANGRAVVAADGVNGTTARRLGLATTRDHLVALEADVTGEMAHRSAHDPGIVLELGVVPGGYAWVFDKGDHLNLGALGWRAEAPRLRNHLDRLARRLAVDQTALERVRGYRLPLRGPGDALSKGRSILIGDAAGLIDPFTGEGIYQAFLSASLGSLAVVELLDGRVRDLESYTTTMLQALGELHAAAWGWRAALDRFPRSSYAFLSTARAWRVISSLIEGRGREDAARLLVPTLLARLVGDPGRPYRREVDALLR